MPNMLVASAMVTIAFRVMLFCLSVGGAAVSFAPIPIQQAFDQAGRNGPPKIGSL
jgi:hypothetical protein